MGDIFFYILSTQLRGKNPQEKKGRSHPIYLQPKLEIQEASCIPLTAQATTGNYIMQWEIILLKNQAEQLLSVEEDDNGLSIFLQGQNQQNFVSIFFSKQHYRNKNANSYSQFPRQVD